IIGDAGYIDAIHQQIGRPFEIKPFTDFDAPGRVFVRNPLAEPLPPGLAPGSPAAAKAAVAWLADAAKMCMSGKVDGMVTAPLNKKSIIQSGQSFIGQ